MTNDGSATPKFGSSSPGNIAGGQTKTVCLLHQTDLSRRWKVSPRTLERWRWQGKGPRFWQAMETPKIRRTLEPGYSPPLRPM
jgi:hypothetical protein